MIDGPLTEKERNNMTDRKAAKAFLTYKGATLAKAVSAAPLLRSVLRLNVFTAFSVWCEEFLILLISSLHFLIYLSLNITL